MARILVKALEKPPWRYETLVVGLPGIGLVGATAAGLLLDRAAQPPRLVYGFYLPGSLRLTHAEADGLSRPRGIWLHSVGEGGLLVLTGSDQPHTPSLQFELASTVLRRASPLGCERVLTLGGYQVSSVGASRRVYFAANDMQTYRYALRVGLSTFDGQVVGAAGVFAGLGRATGLRGGCILGETDGEVPDAAAAKAVVEALDRLLASVEGAR